MRMPGFTAACALYRSTTRYRIVARPAAAPAAVEVAGGFGACGESLVPPTGYGSGCGEIQQGGGACALAGVQLQTDCSAEDIVAKFARCRRNRCLNSVYDAQTCIVTCR